MSDERQPCLFLRFDGRSSCRVVPDAGLRVGSAPDNDLVLRSEFVSWHHVQVDVEDGECVIRDLGSRNGTWVGDVRVTTHRAALPFAFRMAENVEAEVAELDLEDVEVWPLEAALSTQAETPAARRRRTRPATPTQRDVRLQGAMLRLLAREDRAREPWSELLDAFLEALDLEEGVVVRVSRAFASHEWEPLLLHQVGEPSDSLTKLLPALRRELLDGLLQGEIPDESGDTLAGSFAAARRGDDVIVAIGVGRPASDVDPAPVALALKALDSFAHPSALRPKARTRAAVYRLSSHDSSWVDGVSAASRQLDRQMAVALGSDLPVLLLGETGVGKELHARALHGLSSRSQAPFRAINCSAIPAELLEATLFGIVKGAATGVAPRLGLFREADGGTLFLDEIGEMALELQSKLLRVLQEQEVLPVGGSESLPVDVRFVSATNRDPEEAIAAGRLRADLYYRLGGHVVRVPPLRERQQDIPLLVNAFLGDEAARSGRVVPGLSVKAMTELMSRPWPGNVRELEACIRRLVHEARPGEPIRHADVPRGLGGRASGRVPGGLTERVAELEAKLVNEALEGTGGNVLRAARQLGISRARLRRILSRGR